MRSVLFLPSISKLAASFSVPSNTTPSAVFCPGARVRGAPPLMTMMALAPISPTRVTPAASAGALKAASITKLRLKFPHLTIQDSIVKPVAIFRHSPTEGPGYFATYLEAHSIDWKLVKIDAGEALPASAGEFSGLAFMGGPMSVNDDLPWIPGALRLIRAAVDEKVPVLGHCLGAQLMSQALGGTVGPSPQKEIGWGRVDIAEGEQARACSPSAMSTLPQPISFCGLGPTVPPSAWDISCAPRQCPSTGTFSSTAARISRSAPGIQGKSSLTLIGPPMNASPENSPAEAGRASPASIFTSFQSIECASRY